MPALLILVLLLAVSLVLRVNSKIRSYSENMPEHAKPSPLSDALKELIGTAGGVYLSLLLLVSFLQIEIPEKAPFLGTDLNLLAFLSLLLAFVQPILIKAFNMLRKAR